VSYCPNVILSIVADQQRIDTINGRTSSKNESEELYHHDSDPHEMMDLVEQSDSEPY